MSQATSQPRFLMRLSSRWVYVLAAIAVLGVAAASYRFWLPHARGLLGLGAQPANGEGEQSHAAGVAATDSHEGDEHAGHDEGNSIELSVQARKNIGMGDPLKVELKNFTRTISVPGMVVERPARSTIEVTAPMTGVVTRIYPIEGEAVEPGAKLFDLRLTHEELVQLQADLLKSAEELDVIAREIRRIEDLIRDQALPGKQLLERQYEQQKQQAAMRAQRQALLLHGLTNEQVDAILKNRELLQNLTVTVPKTTEDGGMSPAGAVFQVQSLKVAQGQNVTAGDTLAVLADHAQLFIEGEAFERDMQAIGRAAEQGLLVSATLDTDGGKPEVVSNLRVLYLAAKVNPDSRTLDFYVTLPNEKVRDTKLEDGHRFIAWRFRPGQRVQLEIPVETLPNRIVLPADAVVQDGPETYVFTPNGDHFDRRSVHVEYRDPKWVVIANDGSLFPGDLVAPTGAQQLQLALKNKAGGGIDPHAGHNH
ncbi:MAG: efflux RND transporter periplasmic adaptor subunit [Pirellulaceae bacterium]